MGQRGCTSFLGFPWARRLAITLLGAIAAGPGFAQVFPTKPVRIILATSTGSAEDTIARTLGQELAPTWKHPAVVESRPGAAGFIAAEAAAKSAPDGHTLFWGSAGIMAVNPHLYPKIPYDAMKDFVVVAAISAYPYLLVVGPKLNVRTPAELVEVMKSKSVKTTYASYGPGSLTNIAPLMFRAFTGTTVENIQYRSAADALPNIVNGDVDLMFESVGTIEGFLRTGKLRALAVTSSKRLSALPDVPTFEELGYRPFEVMQWNAVFAPAGTPRAIVERLAEDLVKAAQAAEVRERMRRAGFEPMPPMSLEETGAFFRAQYERYGKAIRDLDIRIP
jgi:tripartite-type tricarboxylate transporter receptor subunit TctC